jgi:hypothetical protein
MAERVTRAGPRLTSGLPRLARILRIVRHVSKVPMVAKVLLRREFQIVGAAGATIEQRCG